MCAFTASVIILHQQHLIGGRQMMSGMNHFGGAQNIIGNHNLTLFWQTCSGRRKKSQYEKMERSLFSIRSGLQW